MPRKGFASDFDGTLHFWETDDLYLVSPEILAAIERFRAEGGLFGACTGRPLKGLTRQTDGQISFDFYIAATGASLHDRDQQLLWSKDMPREIARELYETYGLQARDGLALICAADDYYTLNPQRTDNWLLGYAASFDEVPGPFIGFAMETEELETSQAAAEAINRDYAGIAQAYVNLASIDVVPDGCSKGTGVALAKEHFGIELMAGMGDSYNDLPLLEAADIAYTFDTSPDEVKAAADVIVHDAVEAIEDFMRR